LQRTLSVCHLRTMSYRICHDYGGMKVLSFASRSDADIAWKGIWVLSTCVMGENRGGSWFVINAYKPGICVIAELLGVNYNNHLLTAMIANLNAGCVLYPGVKAGLRLTISQDGRIVQIET
jgi:hypothetical protein